MSGLKPCPFCGEGSHEDDREPCPDGDGWVTCGGCGARATEERWNNRCGDGDVSEVEAMLNEAQSK